MVVFILKSGIRCINFINRFGIFCITTGEGLEGMNIYMIALVLACDEDGDDEELEDSKEDHKQARYPGQLLSYILEQRIYEWIILRHGKKEEMSAMPAIIEKKETVEEQNANPGKLRKMEER